MSYDRQAAHVFVSYVRENQEQVDQLCEELTKHGVKVWLDRNDIKPGMRWKDAVREAIRSGSFFIACFSQEYRSRGRTYMNEELALAIEELRLRSINRIWFIPVLLSQCDVPARSIGGGETLLDIEWVTLYGNWEAGIKRILDVIKPIPPEVQILVDALDLGDVEVRRAAAKALGEAGHDGGVPTLTEALKDADSQVRANAKIALQRIDADKALPVSFREGIAFPSHTFRNSVLLIRPLYGKLGDMFEALSFSLGLLAKKAIFDAGFTVIDLAAGNATRANFEDALRRYTNIELILFLGHGSPKGYCTDSRGRESIIDEDNIPLVQDKGCFFICPHSAKGLGHIAAKYAKFFLGYEGKFYLAGHSTESIVADCILSGLAELLKGASPNQAWTAMQMEHNRWIQELESQQERLDPNWFVTAAVLRRNMVSVKLIVGETGHVD